MPIDYLRAHRLPVPSRIRLTVRRLDRWLQKARGWSEVILASDVVRRVTTCWGVVLLPRSLVHAWGRSIGVLVRLEVGRLLWRHTLVTSWLVGDRRWGRVRGQSVHRGRHVPIAREVPALLVVDLVAPVPLISWGGQRCVGHPLAG